MGDFDGIGNLLRAEDNVFFIKINVIKERSLRFRRRCQCGAGGDVCLAASDEVEHGILNDLGIAGQTFKCGIPQTVEDGVSDRTDA